MYEMCCDPRAFIQSGLESRVGLVRSPTLDRRKVEFSRLMLCYPSLDRWKLEFSDFCRDGGLGAPAGVMREAGGLLPIAPCGRSSL
jgi:hypothetical protein